MGLYSVDQARHFYVVTELVDQITATSKVGALSLKRNATTYDPYEPFIFGQYKSPNGNNGPIVVTTDMIPIKNIEFISVDEKGTRPLNKKVISMTKDPIPGMDYGFRITFVGLLGEGIESTLTKTVGFYRAQEGDTKAIVLGELKKLFDMNLKGTPGLVTAKVAMDTLEIEEVAQPFVRGQRVGLPVNFQVSFMPIYDGAYNVWGYIEDESKDNTNTVPNGNIAADMEYFYLGERVAPRSTNFWAPRDYQYLTDPSKEYTFVDIGYYHRGNNEDIQHSRCTMTFVFAKDSGVILDAIKQMLVPGGATTPSTPPVDGLEKGPGALRMARVAPEGEDCADCGGDVVVDDQPLDSPKPKTRAAKK